MSEPAETLLKTSQPQPAIEEYPPVATGDLHRLDILARVVHAIAVSKGFYEDSIPSCIHHVLSKHALISSEIGEMTDAVRSPGMSEKLPSFTTEEEEFADVFIRLLDLGAWRCLRIEEVVLAKINYNRGREYRHGGRKA